MLKGVKRPDKFETKRNFAVSCIEHLEDFWLLHGARGDAWSMFQTLVPMVLVQNYWRIPLILNSVSFKTAIRTQVISSIDTVWGRRNVRRRNVRSLTFVAMQA